MRTEGCLRELRGWGTRAVGNRYMKGGQRMGRSPNQIDPCERDGDPRRSATQSDGGGSEAAESAVDGIVAAVVSMARQRKG
jgi:hypothetical protein